MSRRKGAPNDLCRENASEQETAYLLRSETMKRRLLEARERREGIPFDEVCEKLGVSPEGGLKP